MHTGTIKPTHTTALHTCPNCGNQDVDVERDGEFTPSVLRTHCNRCKRETAHQRQNHEKQNDRHAQGNG